MKNLKLFVIFAVGLGVLGFVVSRNSKWLKSKLICSSCCGSKSSHNGCSSNGKSNINNKTVYTINIASDEGGEPLAKFAPGNDIELQVLIQNNPVLTDKCLEKKIAETYGQMLQQDISVSNLPKQQIKMFFDQLVQIEGVRRAELNNILASEENRKKLANHMEQALTNFVMMNIYEKAKETAKVSPDDVRAEYDNNKSRFIKELGGIRLIGAKYDNKEDAEQQLTLMSDKDISNVVEFTREIKDSEVSGGQIRDFGYVSKDFPRGADAQLVDAAENFEQYPGVDIVSTNDNEHWLLMATEAKTVTHYSFEECKQRITAMLEQQTVLKAVNDALAKGATESKAEVIKSSYFEEVSTEDNEESEANSNDDESLKGLFDDAANMSGE